MRGHVFSECAEVEARNRSKGLINYQIYIPNASKTNKDMIIRNNKIQTLNKYCKKCDTELKGRIWQYLGICAMCDMQ